MAQSENKLQLSSHFMGNLYGVISILLWATVIAFTRNLTEELGTFRSGAYVLIIGGLLSTVFFFLRHRGLAAICQFSMRYWLVCGGLFIVYEVFLYIAIGFSHSRQQVLEVGLINYLWIGFTLLLSVPLLKKKAGFMLLPGIFIGFAGIAIAIMSKSDGSQYSISELQTNLAQNPWPYILSFFAAVAWSLYSNYTRSLAANTNASVVPFFLLASGIFLLSIAIFTPETSHWSISIVAKLLYAAVFPAALSYVFWDIAMRKGNLILITSLSYFIPLASTVSIGFLLDVPISANIWTACILVTVGAAICRFSIKD